MPAATVWRILQRNGLNRRSWIDRPTGRVIRRYERSSPGELVHVDVKKVGQIPPGGGWRIHGRNSAQARRSKRRPAAHPPQTLGPRLQLSPTPHRRRRPARITC